MKQKAKCQNCEGSFEYRTSQSYGKYCSNKCQQAKEWLDWKKEVEQKQSADGCGVHTVKKYLIEVKGQKCEICQITEWLGKPLVTILDHIDGNSSNWKLDNLRLLCSNCDSTLLTYKNRNKGNGRFSRRKRYAEGLSY